ncbi:Bug family tripartite tricarboxylate transporter substrate binding protein [Paracoccus sp. P2]
MGRYVAEKLSAEWQQPVVVENRPGAGSMIGAASVSHARPDGHALLIVSGSYTTSAAIQKGLPFDPATDLKPVGLVGVGHYLLIAGSRHPIGSMAELAALAKEQKVFYGTTGVGSISHLSGQLLNDILGTQMEAVHYEGGSPAMVDLGGGRLDLFIGSPSEAGTGLGKPIATFSNMRLASLPDVPTVAEAGFPDAEVAAWWGILAPAGTPDDIVVKINADIARVMGSPEGAAFLAAAGAVPPQMDAQQFADHVNGELERWTALAEKHGIQSN